MSDKIFIGSGKERKFDNGGSVISVSLEIDDIQQLFDSYGFKSKSGKRYLKLKIGQRREVGKYGETHTVEVDTWKPDSASGNSQQNHSSGQHQKNPAGAGDDGVPPDFPDDIPF